MVLDTALINNVSRHVRHEIKEHFFADYDLETIDKQSQEFLTFQSHDSDNDGKLDGLELLAAIMHDTTHPNSEEVRG